MKNKSENLRPFRISSKVNGWTLLSRKQALERTLEDIGKDIEKGVLLHPSIVEQYKQQLAEVNRELTEDRQRTQQIKNILYPKVKLNEI